MSPRSKLKSQQTRKTEVDHELALEVVEVVEASSHEGLQPLVSLERDEELMVKPVGPEKMARLEMQLHEMDHLSKRGILGATTLDASRLFMTFIPSDLLLSLGSLRSLVFHSSNCGVVFAFVLLCSPRDTVQYSPDNACAFLWIQPSYCFSPLHIDGISEAHQLTIVFKALRRSKLKLLRNMNTMYKVSSA